jgi:multidrug transporter EmrE-like cation transporter
MGVLLFGEALGLLKVTGIALVFAGIVVIRLA